MRSVTAAIALVLALFAPTGSWSVALSKPQPTRVQAPRPTYPLTMKQQFSQSLTRADALSFQQQTSIDRLQELLKLSPSPAKSKTIAEQFRDVEARHIELQDLQRTIELQSIELQREKDALSAAKVVLEKHTTTLEAAKTALENREKMFSFGILAALTTALIAIVSLIGKLPTLKVERRLKELEVEEKILKLAVMRKSADADA